MGILRLIGALLLLAIGLALVLYLFTGNRRFLRAAWRIFQFAVVLLIVFMALLIIERLFIHV